jgi:transcriptional regulator with XRE-family HTH domain
MFFIKEHKYKYEFFVTTNFSYLILKDFTIVIFLAENIKRLRLRKGVSQAAMAASVGFPRTTLSSYEQNAAQPDIDGLLVIAAYFGVDLNDLLTQQLATDVPVNEKGRINKTDKRVKEHVVAKPKDYGSEPPLTVASEPPALYRLNVLDVEGKSTAAILQILQDADKALIAPNLYLPNLGPGQHIRIQVTGNSMHPLIKDKDIVIATKVPEGPSGLKDGQVYLYLGKDDSFDCRRLYRSGNDQVEMVADNEDHKRYTRQADDIQMLFKVQQVHSSNLEKYQQDSRQEIANIWKAIGELREEKDR